MSSAQIDAKEAFRPCAVIPNYNHKERVGGIVEAALAAGLACILVDDASGPQTRAVLEALAEAHDRVELLHHAENRGKGGAVKTGLLHAASQGFTHALQIDADGQHDVDDIPRLLAAAQAHPDALVLGRPIFDESIPKGRLYPRYITHVWVWIETLSLELQDSMCGFRVYPLAATCDLLGRVPTGDRMDFDIEIAVRLYWDNIPFVSVDTAVLYHPDGISHFRLWMDNVLISWLHTRLCLGMFWRAPWLLFRKRRRIEATSHWARTPERGSAWGMRFVLGLYRLCGRRVARLFLWPIIGYFFLTGRKARQASQLYLERLYATDEGQKALGEPPTRATSFRHFLSFGRAALEKLSAWIGDIGRADTRWPPETRQLLLDHLERKEGAVLLGAHLGNIEVLRAIAGTMPQLKMNVLVFTAHAAQFNAIVESLHPDSQVELIAVDKIGVETGIMLKQRVEQGEFVAILADRVSPGAEHRAQIVEFLGHPAPFPEGPFVLASLLKCHTYLLFCLQNPEGIYEIHLEPFAQRVELPRKRRKEALKAIIAKYARRLEAYCCKAPLQWFNFYDFWKPPAPKREEAREIIEKAI